MARSRDESFDRNPRASDLEHRRHRHRTRESRRHETSEDALNDFYGGTANIDDPDDVDSSYRKSYRPSQARTSRSWTRTRPQRPAGISYSNSVADISDIRPYEPSEDDLYLSGPSGGNWRKGEWRHAAKEVTLQQRDPFAEHTVTSLEPRLVVTRRGRRLTSDPFYYEKGWTDGDFAEKLKDQYANLKLRDVGFFQKLVAYKQISYVIVLQKRYAKRQRKRVIVKSVPITNKGDKEDHGIHEIET